jgi:hypothetical protein
MIFLRIQYFKYLNGWNIFFEWHTWMFMFNTQKSHTFIQNYIMIIARIYLKCKLYLFHIKTPWVKKTYNLYNLYYIYIYIASFLDFEVHRCYIDILFYDFCTNSSEILWYCKFVMYITKLTKRNTAHYHFDNICIFVNSLPWCIRIPTNTNICCNISLVCFHVFFGNFHNYYSYTWYEKNKLFSNMDVANVPYFENIGLSFYLLHLHISCVYSNIQWWLLSQEHFSNVWHSLISSIFVAHINYVLEAMSGSCLGMWPFTSKNLLKCSNIGNECYSINHWEKFPSAFQEHLICINISLRPS